MFEKREISSPASKIKKYLIFENEDPETVIFADLYFRLKQLQTGQIKEKTERESIFSEWNEIKTLKKESGEDGSDICLYEFKNKHYKVRCVPQTSLHIAGKLRLSNLDTNYFVLKISKDRSTSEIEKEISVEVHKDEFNIYDLVGGEDELKNNMKETLMNLGLSHLIGKENKPP